MSSPNASWTVPRQPWLHVGHDLHRGAVDLATVWLDPGDEAVPLVDESAGGDVLVVPVAGSPAVDLTAAGRPVLEVGPDAPHAVVPAAADWRVVPLNAARKAAQIVRAIIRPGSRIAPAVDRLQPGADWRTRGGLTAHVEGGAYREVLRSTATTQSVTGASRAAATTIYYLLDRASPQGRLHRNASDITHVLIAGGPVVYELVEPIGVVHRVVMGSTAGQYPVMTCPGGWWKASHLPVEVEKGVVVELVVPGFDYDDMQLATPEILAVELGPAAAAAVRGDLASGALPPWLRAMPKLHSGTPPCH